MSVDLGWQARLSNEPIDGSQDDATSSAARNVGPPIEYWNVAIYNKLELLQRAIDDEPAAASLTIAAACRTRGQARLLDIEHEQSQQQAGSECA